MSLLLALLTVIDPEGCGQCHAVESEAFAHTRHATARIGALYVANHAEEPMRWCDGCHAPAGVASDGLGCSGCHVREGKVLTSHTLTAKGLSAHPLVQSAALTDGSLCGECHQVNFPIGHAEPVTPSQFRMQSTLDEWKQADSSRTCVDCHLPDGNHRVTGGHDVARVQRALEVELAPLGTDELRLTLRNVGAAHSLPTGDPFRAFIFELCVDADCERVTSRQVFGRVIEKTGDTWRISRDWTVPARTSSGPGVRSIDVPRPGGAAFWRLSLRYVGDSTARHVDPSLVSSELFRGSLPPRG